MSPRRVTGEGAGSGRGALVALAVLVVAIAMMVLTRARPASQAFDPRSGAPTGARGLVLLLERYGADVQITRTVPSGAGRRVLVLQDRLTDAQRAAVRGLAAAGAVVVVADPASPLAGQHGTTTIDTRGEVSGPQVDLQANLLPGRCDIPALAHLRGVHVVNGVLLHRSGERSCFGDTTEAFTVAHPEGRGVVVALGDNLPWTNQYLRLADNAGLATALLAPARGGVVTIVVGDRAPKTVADIGTGTRTLADLVRPGVWMALVGLAVAFVVLAVARAVRPGRPVREPEQVPVAGSELVVATGRLMQRARHAPRAGWLLRGDLYRELCSHHHLPPTTPLDALDRAVSERHGIAPGRVAEVLQRDVDSEAALVGLARDIQQIRQLVLEGATT